MITCFQRKQSQRVYFTIILIFSCYKKLKNIFTIMFFSIIWNIIIGINKKLIILIY